MKSRLFHVYTPIHELWFVHIYCKRIILFLAWLEAMAGYETPDTVLCNPKGKFLVEVGTVST
jgi:hypothetical protein